MSRFTGRPQARAKASDAARAASELLELLWGRGQEAAPAGTISPSQLRALLIIEKREGANLRSLGRALGSRASSVSRLCDRMQAMGLVERCPSPTSRREVELRLTSHGHVLLNEYRGIRAREVAVVLDAMEPAAVEALTKGLTAFHAAATVALDVEAGGSGDHRGDQVADSA
ncbi:MarR family winged helix-turn-helix transcriptional regulator [Streptomyces sp. NBC_00344]|uniref:MarR family winged helix-turn-helix transcriptional regulator n=1 Tax=Streptomyces sp. NBC_00344 TaxID=2975720 RepID=UPI002E1EDBC7